jgi:hypothetical protein
MYGQEPPQVHQPRRDARRDLPVLACRPGSEIFEAIWEMSQEAYREYYRLRGIVYGEERSARSLARIQRRTS